MDEISTSNPWRNSAISIEKFPNFPKVFLRMAASVSQRNCGGVLQWISIGIQQRILRDFFQELFAEIFSDIADADTDRILGCSPEEISEIKKNITNTLSNFPWMHWKTSHRISKKYLGNFYGIPDVFSR